MDDLDSSIDALMNKGYGRKQAIDIYLEGTREKQSTQHFEAIDGDKTITNNASEKNYLSQNNNEKILKSTKTYKDNNYNSSSSKSKSFDTNDSDNKLYNNDNKDAYNLYGDNNDKYGYTSSDFNTLASANPLVELINSVKYPNKFKPLAKVNINRNMELPTFKASNSDDEGSDAEYIGDIHFYDLNKPRATNSTRSLDSNNNNNNNNKDFDVMIKKENLIRVDSITELFDIIESPKNNDNNKQKLIYSSLEVENEIDEFILRGYTREQALDVIDNRTNNNNKYNLNSTFSIGRSSPPNFVDESEIDWLISCGYNREQAVKAFLEKTHSPVKRETVSVKQTFSSKSPPSSPTGDKWIDSSISNSYSDDEMDGRVEELMRKGYTNEQAVKVVREQSAKSGKSKKSIEEPVKVEVDMEELLKRGYTYEQALHVIEVAIENKKKIQSTTLRQTDATPSYKLYNNGGVTKSNNNDNTFFGSKFMHNLNSKNSVLSEDEVMRLCLLISEQESLHGIHMYESLVPEDEEEINKMKEIGISNDDAILMIFDKRFGNNKAEVLKTDSSDTESDNKTPKKSFFGFSFFKSNSNKQQSPPEKVQSPSSTKKLTLTNVLSPSNLMKKSNSMKINEKDIKTLMALGFSRMESEVALTDNNNDVQKAALLLISGNN